MVWTRHSTHIAVATATLFVGLHTSAMAVSLSSAYDMGVNFLTQVTFTQSDKIRAYSMVYPQLFTSAYQPISYKATPTVAVTAAKSGVSSAGRPAVIKLLLASFNNETDYASLSAVLKQGHVAVTSPAPAVVPAMQEASASVLKSKDEIMPILTKAGLSWEDYQRLTEQVASDNESFEAFFKALDSEVLQERLIQRAQSDPRFVKDLNSAAHQAILQKLLKRMADKA